MFEQTLLTQPPSGQKTRALAASFMAQMSLLGVLLVAPLLYTQVLPLVVEPPKLTVLMQEPAPVQQVAAAAPAGNSSSQTLSLPRPAFVPPTRVPTGPITNAPLVETGIGTTGIDVRLGSPTGDIPGGGNTEGFPNLPKGSAEPVTNARVVTPAPPPPPSKPVPVNSVLQASKLIKRVLPLYPNPARIARITGTVRLLALIGKDGRVVEVRTLEGHAFLRRAAEDAVRQWVYSPTILNGVAVEVESSIDVHFALQ